MKINFGQLIGRVNPSIRERHSLGEDIIYSVKGMSDNELRKIQRTAPEVLGMMQPILLEMEHSLVMDFFRNPTMTPGEIQEFYSSFYERGLTAVQAELRERGKL